jgi:tetratricopeptide (TPR) repeat protein
MRIYCIIALCWMMVASPVLAASPTTPEPPEPGTQLIREGVAWLLAVRAQGFMLASQFDAAYGDLNTAISLSPANPALYVLRGQVQLARYEWDASASDYNTAIAIDPNYADAYFYRGVLRYSILQTGLALREDALSDFVRYLQLAPQGTHADATARYIETLRAEIEDINGD